VKHFKTEYDQITGVRHDYYWDDENDQMTIRNRHYIADILESNKRQFNKTTDARYGNEMVHHVADIPVSLWIRWKRDEGVDILDNTEEAKRFLKRKLNDPEFRHLKRMDKRL